MNYNYDDISDDNSNDNSDDNSDDGVYSQKSDDFDYFNDGDTSSDEREPLPEDNPNYCFGCDKICNELIGDICYKFCLKCWLEIGRKFLRNTNLYDKIIKLIFIFLDINDDAIIRIQKSNGSRIHCIKHISFQISEKKYNQCTDGIFCRFLHVIKSIEVCSKFSEGTCRSGNLCPKSHKKPELCNNYEKRGKCGKFDTCQYIHRKHIHRNHTSDKCCPYFLNGYCFFGDKCNKMHNLVESKGNNWLSTEKYQIRNKTSSSSSSSIDSNESKVSKDSITLRNGWTVIKR